jgi:hypothetical protein
MIRLTPVFISGMLLGVLGFRRNEPRNFGWLGARLNGWALVPSNLIPLLSYVFKWVRL